MISSLEAIRKLTQSQSKPKDPIETFQNYLEPKNPTNKKPISSKMLQKGASVGLINHILLKFHKRVQENYLKIWKFETIQEELNYDNEYINSRISYTLSSAFSKIRKSQTRTFSQFFYKWKHSNSRQSCYDLILKLSLIFVRRLKQKHFFNLKNRLFFESPSKRLKLKLTVSRMKRFLREKFCLWKRRVTQLQELDEVIVLLKFSGNKDAKLAVFLSLVRTRLFRCLKKAFISITSQKEPKVLTEEKKETLKETSKISIKRLEKQKEQHLNSVIEANIKVQLVDMMMQLINTVNK